MWSGEARPGPLTAPASPRLAFPRSMCGGARDRKGAGGGVARRHGPAAGLGARLPRPDSGAPGKRGFYAVLAELAERSQQIREAVRNSQGGGIRYPYTGLFDDGNGNLVVTLWPSDVAGAVIAPETGCHSILLDTEPQRASRRLAGMYRDSVVVFGNQTDVQMIDGKRTTVTYAGEAFMIALRPLRPAGGKPCPAP